MRPGKAIQFLDAKPKAEAERIWHQALRLDPLPAEEVPLDQARGRVLAADLVAPIDLPPFDRAIVDGYALQASDTFSAGETTPARLRLLSERILAGVAPRSEVVAGTAVEIATGGVVPRGASGVVMVERTDLEGDTLLVYRPIVPGAGIQSAGSDLRAGEVVLPRLTRLSSRETGVVAALGIARVACVRRPRVAVASTGDELQSPGGTLSAGRIFDANARVVSDALAENGAEVVFLGIVPDDEERLRAVLAAAKGFDAVVLSGGTSKGTGDLSFRLIDEMGKPGILVHGVQVKPGKPVVLAAWDGVPVVVLPGFPTSAILTFNLFVRPVVRRLGGLPAEAASATVEATVPDRIHSAPGRHEYVLVSLVRGAGGALAAYPVGKSSGSISAFAEADAYLEVPESRDLLLAGETARATLISGEARPADLVFIGSHCQGMALLFSLLRESHGLHVKAVNVGSSGGIMAVTRGEADVAGVHLLGADGRYNRAALAETGGRAVLVRGYRRRQGILYRPDGREPGPTLEALARDPSLRLANRARGTGTRVLLDLLLDALARDEGRDPEALRRGIPGWDSQVPSHAGVALAIASGRADWGLAIEAAALARGLGFVPLRDEEYDLLVPRERLLFPPLQALVAVMRSERFRLALEAMGGFLAAAGMGEQADGP